MVNITTLVYKFIYTTLVYKFPIMSVVEYYYKLYIYTYFKQNYGYHSVVISAFIKKILIEEKLTCNIILVSGVCTIEHVL